MKITIACVGKIKEKYFVNAIEEYSKRLSRYVTLNIAEVPDEKAPENMSLAQMEQVPRALKAVAYLQSKGYHPFDLKKEIGMLWHLL